MHAGPEPEDLLRVVPFFRDLDRVSLARLAGALERIEVRAGRIIFREGDEADGVYLLASGEVISTVRSGQDVDVAMTPAPGHFGELGLLLTRRAATVTARTDSVLWRLPREHFEHLVRARPEIALGIATTMAATMDRRQRALVGAPPRDEEVQPLVIEQRNERRTPARRVSGALLAFLVPLALWWVSPPAGLDLHAWRVVLVLVGAAIAWMLEPVPDFAVAIGLAAAWGISGGGTLAAVFGGFATSTWVLAFSGLTLVAALARSGLLYRAGLLLLRAFPPTHTGQVLALIVGGVLVTPFVPQSVARVAAIGPVTSELRTILGQPARSAGAAALAFAGLVGYWYFSNMFLTGFATNFFVLELVPASERDRFGWWGWAVAALVPLVLSLLAATAAILVMFRPTAAERPTAGALNRQTRVIGGLSRSERFAALAATILVVGLLAQPLIQIDAAWLASIALVIAIAGVLSRDAFRTGIDWAFLVLLGILMGSAAVLQDAGVDRWLSAALAPVVAGAPHPGVLVVGLAAVVVLMRFVLPSRPTILLMALVSMPAAPTLGISPWVAGFVVLSAANVWVFPYMGLEYLVLRDATRGEAFTDGQGMRIGLALLLIRLLVIAASVPYWIALGLIAS